MSEYGPATFVSRRDGHELSPDERATILDIVRSACRTLEITDDDGDPVTPAIYDYDGYEPRALGILLHASSIYGLMPEEVQADEQARWEADGVRLAAEVEERAPGTYGCVSYVVEV